MPVCSALLLRDRLQSVRGRLERLPSGVARLQVRCFLVWWDTDTVRIGYAVNGLLIALAAAATLLFLLLHWFRRFPPLPPYLQIALWNNKNNAMIWAVGSFVWHSFGQAEAVSSNISAEVDSFCLFKDETSRSTQTLQPPNHPTGQHFFKASKPFCATVWSSLPVERESVTNGIDRFRHVASAVKSGHITIIGCGSLQLSTWTGSSFS